MKNLLDKSILKHINENILLKMFNKSWVNYEQPVC